MSAGMMMFTGQKTVEGGTRTWKDAKSSLTVLPS